MQIYLGDTPLDKNIGIRLGDTNIQNVAMGKFLTIEYLVVGGGGAGQDGGGGAGGYVTGSVLLSSGRYSVLVGDKGIANAYPSSNPSTAQFGKPSSFSFSGSVAIATALGGGRGMGGNTTTGDGGSGGGGGFSNQPGGSGTPPQGFNGGNGGPADNGAGGGGGGAAEAGVSYSTTVAGRGGNGKQWLDGNYYAGGGGGGTKYNTGQQPGGLGGGGTGAAFASAGSAGVANTGGGGGGYWTQDPPYTFGPKDGGTGIVKLRYLGTPQATGGTITESGGYTYHSFTNVGTSIFEFTDNSL